jgi:hypothetical protein
LYTKEYHEMSEKVFGRYLHHQPFHEEESKEKRQEESHIKLLQRLHQEEFGQPLYDTVYSVGDLFSEIYFLFKRLNKPR